MVMANHERIGKALEYLRDGLAPVCEKTWEGFFGDGWLQEVNGRLHHPESNPATSDAAFLFKGIKVTWNDVFGAAFGPGIRSMVFELAEARNDWAHQNSFTADDSVRAMDTMERVLEAFGVVEERKAIRTLRRDLMRQMFDEEARSERRKTAARPTEGQPQAGLSPWRDVMTPHEDVATGRFDQAEFAADLYEVANGTADEEYQDPKQFFSRTYLTEGLGDMLSGAARRLSGDGGDPVIELQTNFGGGKTHSMIALWHLASGIPANQLAGVGELLAEKHLALPDEIARASLVGQTISPSAPFVAEDGIELHTLWGHLAYQLGGRAGYDLVRTDDEAGTNPGAALKTLFERFGPGVVLIDEWVAYARQLRDGDSDRLAGGDFDTQFTFAQTLTETASAVPNVVVLVSIPASDIEVGGERGQVALTKLKAVVSRKAAHWQPASPNESFEIVRRRLFDPITEDKARVRDGVIRAFMEMYKNSKGEFPSGTDEAEYRRRMEQSYPIHPELFDRLFGDWSALDKFQRTRGVLRLMALAISRLWQSGDQSLLIMPGSLPMDWGPLVSEMRKYLEDGWDPVIKSDVDGENSLPLRIDNEVKHFGRISATRRAARTVYLASSPRPDGSRGTDIRSVVLGCAQPGEPVGQFADALKRLSGQATHLYVDGAQYWYSLQPNVTRVAADRAASNYTDRDADDEVRRRISAQSDRGNFSAMQVFAEGPGDVPDDDDGVRLVVLAPDATHTSGDEDSPAARLAASILSQREGGPRLNRNMLVFTAADPNRLAELRAAARQYLAWRSIVADHEALDLTPHQKKQAESKVNETSTQVDSLIGETFTQVLTPSQQAGTADVTWKSTKASTNGDIGARVTNKLTTEEKLIAAYSGVRIRMDIDRLSLWSDRHDLSVGDLWTAYARYPYMTRLSSFDVLAIAVGDGTASMSWTTETFAYSEAYNDDGDRWVGVRTGENVSPTRSGLLIHPDHVPEPEAPGGESLGEPGSKSGEGESGEGSGPGQPRGGGGKQPPDSDAPQDFYAVFNLDAVRCVKDFNAVVENVLNHLGTEVEIAVEIRAKDTEGFNDATRRTVSENAKNLGATAAEFE